MFGNKEDNYYFDGFVAQCEYTFKIAQKATEKLSRFDYTRLKADMEEVHLIEHEADNKQHEIINKLTKEFIAPIEREDIVMLAQSLDSLTDAIEDIFVYLYMFDVKEIRPDAVATVALIEQTVLQLLKLLKRFHNYKKDKTLLDDIIEINRLEETGDERYHQSLHSLFANEQDTKKILIWREMFGKLELVLDTAEDVANEVESTIMKNT